MSNCYQRGAQGGPTGNLESFMVHKVGQRRSARFRVGRSAGRDENTPFAGELGNEHER